MKLSVFYTIISLLTAGFDLLFAIKAYRKETDLGRYLCRVCLSATAVNISYLFSVRINRYFFMSLASSIYFAFVAVMLFSFLNFVLVYAKVSLTPRQKLIRKFYHAYLIFDITTLMINPFLEIVMHYVPRNTPIAKYSYDMMPLYQIHLISTYIVIIVCLNLLIQKTHKTPSVYRRPYIYTILGIIGIVFYNAVFLFWPHKSVLDFLDYSIWGYSFCVFFIYWNCYSFSRNGMLNYFRNWILENINQGIVLFDYENNIIALNHKAKELLPQAALKPGTTLQEFLKESHIHMEPHALKTNHSFQYYKKKAESFSPIRCDYRPYKSDSDELIGQLFVFTDNTYEMDLLTGFYNWEYFKQTVALSDHTEHPKPMTVAICDINGLQNINDVYGRSIGDRAIGILSSLMKETFPSNTYFVRGTEATLIAVCFGSYTEESIQKLLTSIRQQFQNTQELGCSLDMQSSVSQVSENQPGIMAAIQNAMHGMKAKKLMDRSSSHSELMTSLVCALQETDNDTEAHVKRTQIMGTLLAKRLELSDLQISNLSLLCILHDIGKIGIPLEILNKPGKLTDAEWKVLKTHVEKGYQIVKSSHELQPIAEMVRHHHERWDGNGYPDGLSKESIPLLSRIISVVDAYDAMVNNRSYRSAIPHEKALAELKRCAGTQFDPVIVSEFLQLAETDERIKNLRSQKSFETDVKSDVYHASAAALFKTSTSLQNYVHPLQFSRYILDEDNIIIQADENFEKLTGYTQEDIRNLHLSQMDLICPTELKEYQALLAEQLSIHSMAYFEHRLRQKNGSIRYVFCYGKLFYDSATRQNRSEIIITDSSETYTLQTILSEEQLKAQNRLEQWEKKYRCDSLTGLLTHEAFQNDVSARLLSAESDKIMLLMLDIDYFKRFNDTYGHREGDQFLILVAQSLSNALRKQDLACRMGGDEFAAALFFTQQDSEQTILNCAQQVFDKINLTLASAKGGTSLSMGIAISSPTERSFPELYENADKALYQSKKNGRSCMTLYQKP